MRTSKVHGFYSLMIARRSYEYKATSSQPDLTLGGQATFWLSVELLKARGHRGGSHQCLPHPSVQPCIPASLHLSTAPSWPHSRSPCQVCLHRYDRKQNVSILPVCVRRVGSFFPSVVFISKHFRAFFKSLMSSRVSLWFWAPVVVAEKVFIKKILTKHVCQFCI